MKNHTKPRCPYYGTCGGCQLQHLSYDEQLNLKRETVRSALKKAGLENISVEPTLGMDHPWFYRNKIQFPIRKQNNHLQMGYFKPRTHEVVNIKECYIQDPFLTEIAQIARETFEKRGLSAYDEKTGNGLLRHFIARSGFQTHEILLGIVINGKGIPSVYTVADEIKKREKLMRRQAARHLEYAAPYPDRKMRIVGIVQNINTARSNVILGEKNTTLFGTPFLREKLGGFHFNIRLTSFFQVNPVQTVKLYDLVKKFADLSGNEIVVDAYAGIGTIAIWLADKAKSIIAIEERNDAIKDANSNLDLNKMTKILVKHSIVEKAFPKDAEVVILDPPRSGCSNKVLQILCRIAPPRIVYVSCNPETLARDLGILSQSGYQIEIVQPVDMFPQTEHVEVVAKLSRE